MTTATTETPIAPEAAPEAPPETQAPPSPAPLAVSPQAIPAGIKDKALCVLLDRELSRLLWQQAEHYARSSLVPAQYQGQPDNCFVALQLAVRFDSDPFMVMQHTYVVKGRPGLEAKFIIGLVNTSGKFRGPIQWRLEGEGDTRICTAFATHATTGEICEMPLAWQTVIGEGWLKNSKWTTMPDLMLRYRSAAWFARLYCPEVIMGMQSADELRDVEAQVINVEQVDRKKTRTDALSDRLLENTPPDEAPAGTVTPEERQALDAPQQAETAEVAKAAKEKLALSRAQQAAARNKGTDAPQDAPAS